MMLGIAELHFIAPSPGPSCRPASVMGQAVPGGFHTTSPEAALQPACY